MLPEIIPFTFETFFLVFILHCVLNIPYASGIKGKIKITFFTWVTQKRFLRSVFKKAVGPNKVILLHFFSK